MSAAFKYRGELFWGTNGMIEECLDVFAEVAAEEYGYQDEIAEWSRRKKEQFFSGMVVVLDLLLTAPGTRERLVLVMERSATRLCLGDRLGELGITWVKREIPRMIAKIRDVQE